jgi:tetratricopeptide (TPR) repeat protein
MSQADTLKDKGIKLYQDYEYEQALQVFEQAKEAYQGEGKADMVAEMQVNMGLVHRALDEGQQAIEVMQQALKTFQNMADALRTAQTLGNLGGVYAKLDDHEQAYNCYRQAADIFEELGEKKMYGDTLLAMGNLQMKEGKFVAGAATYQAGLEEMENLSVNQRIIKSLSGTINRLTGGATQLPKADKPDDSEA